MGGMRSAVGRLLRRHGLMPEDEPAAPSARGASAPLPLDQFVNPIAEGADPFVVRDGHSYLWTQTVGDVGVAVCRSDRLTSLGVRTVVWRAPATGMFSQQVWAPELIRLDGRWHIYFAASDGRNETHRAYVLVADSDDPQGSYTLHGPLETDGWAIDLTVLPLGEQRYAMWSGWPDDETRVQHLYIAPMASPTALAGPRVLMADPYAYPWERIRDDDPEPINEGPQVLRRGGRTFVVYSCGSALLPSYKYGLLELVGDDPLLPECWHKFPSPIFQSTPETFGVGHGSFVQSTDGSEWWAVYHRKIVRKRNFKRVLHVQPMSWSPSGEPVLGEPVAAGVPLALPSGTPVDPRTSPASWDLTSGRDVRVDFDYYGHQQFLTQDASGVHLGLAPAVPVNAFRTGEKLVLRDGDYDDVRVTATFEVTDGDKAVGILLRTTAASVGVDAQRGYFAGWVEGRSRLVVGRSDGVGWTPLGSVPVDGAREGSRVLEFEARGAQLTAKLGGVSVAVADEHFSRGSVGVRVVNTTALFTRLEITTPGGD